MNRLIRAFEPYENCVACLPSELKTESGLVLPSTIQQKTNLGKVIAIGKGVEGIAVGDRLTYKQCFLVEMPRQADEPEMENGVRVEQFEKLIIITKDQITGRIPSTAYATATAPREPVPAPLS